MHRAKGLSADVVFIVGAEKQFIPGKNTGIREDDERRLLYVSITRARHELVITYCNERTGNQRFTGSESKSGNIKREITHFLKDIPLTVEQMN
jgi:DNA helicase-2/ATP-dependent DNA helicase PcrA